MTTAFIGNWADKNGLINDFAISKDEIKGIKFLVAFYIYEDYSGSAFVLFRRQGKLYEQHGGHCSCNGLEGQWDPEEITGEQLLHRVDNGYLPVDDNVKKKLRRIARREIACKGD